MAKQNPFRFSTKYQDDETDLLYYGYRYYTANTGRWLSRDPLYEGGGLNLYGFAHAEPTGKIDTGGREVGGICPRCGRYYVGFCSCGPDDPEYRKRHIEAALQFHITAALGAHATYDSVMRELYNVADQKTFDGVKRLVSEGVLTPEEGAALYVQKVNKLVLEFRDRSSPLGRYIAERIKPSASLPTAEQILSKKTAAEVMARAHKGVS